MAWRLGASSHQLNQLCANNQDPGDIENAFATLNHDMSEILLVK